MKVNNHYFPRLHIRKWEKQNCRIFDIEKGISRRIKVTDFSEKNFIHTLDVVECHF